MAKEKVYTLVLAWGESDEGNYHTALRATNLNDAIRLAREEMDASYNEEYCTGKFACEPRGIAADEETTEYEVVDHIEGVNEFAASDMLDALKHIIEIQALVPNSPADRMVREAIAKGEARA